MALVPALLLSAFEHYKITLSPASAAGLIPHSLKGAEAPASQTQGVSADHQKARSLSNNADIPLY